MSIQFQQGWKWLRRSPTFYREATRLSIQLKVWVRIWKLHFVLWHFICLILFVKVLIKMLSWYGYPSTCTDNLQKGKPRNLLWYEEILNIQAGCYCIHFIYIVYYQCSETRIFPLSEDILSCLFISEYLSLSPFLSRVLSHRTKLWSEGCSWADHRKPHIVLGPWVL